MEQNGWRPLTGKGGWRGRVFTESISYGGSPHARIEVDGSEPILVPREMLHDQPEGGYSLPLTLEQLLQNSQSIPAAASASAAAPTERPAAAEELVVPVVVEEVDIRKRHWETGGVRVGIEVREREELIDEPRVREEVSVERIPVNQVVATAPGVRQEGNTTIIPVLEEVLVVEKRLVLKEEVRITKRRFEAHEPQKVLLKSEEPRIERLQPNQRPGEQRRVA